MHSYWQLRTRFRHRCHRLKESLNITIRNLPIHSPILWYISTERSFKTVFQACNLIRFRKYLFLKRNIHPRVLETFFFTLFQKPECTAFYERYSHDLNYQIRVAVHAPSGTATGHC